ncbi:MAG: twin-arginine translocase subunit TatC [Candidatus Nanopelagicales bacterium]|nr:twin-arginine translocase subunit TatC [Candidatus Nanopelagicales bacterium]MDZ4249429.1 twin-arginine translocase subunit TatC [Candidatus Nanopelagicales bacterium]
MTTDQTEDATRVLDESASEAPSGMSITDHLRELRSRVVKSALAVLVGTVVGWIFYDQIFAILRAPIDSVIASAQSADKDVKLVVTGVTQAFTLQLQVSAVAGVILASPVWIYQMWRFITPGLRKREKLWTFAFVGAAVPLFLTGVFLSYWVLPKALDLLLGFTPSGVANYMPIDTYLSFFTRMVVIFGVGFLTPLILVALNIVGVLTGKRLASWWRFIIFAVFVFAAVATPTGDPITLLELALPILLLVGLALGFCFLNDKRRARRRAEPEYSDWADDETSPLGVSQPGGGEVSSTQSGAGDDQPTPL